MPKFDEAVIEPPPVRVDAAMSYDGLDGAEWVFGQSSESLAAQGYTLEPSRLVTPAEWVHALRVRQEQLDRLRALSAPALIIASAAARVEKTREGVARAVRASVQAEMKAAAEMGGAVWSAYLQRLFQAAKDGGE